VHLDALACPEPEGGELVDVPAGVSERPPVSAFRVVPVFLMTTYSALRLAFDPVSAPGESK